MMKTAKALYQLTRPVNALIGALAVFLGGYVARTGNWQAVWLAALSCVLVNGASNAWNDFLDIEIDKINKPNRPLASGALQAKTAVYFSLLLSFFSLLLAALINPPSFLVVLLANLLLYIYSWKLKSTILLGNAVVATTCALSALFGGLAAGNWQPTIWLFIPILVVIMGREILKTMADYEGDALHDVRTVSTVWGMQTAQVLFLCFGAVIIVTLALPIKLQIYRPIYTYIVGFGILPILLYIFAKTRPSAPARQLEFLSQLMKYDFFVWFIAVALGASA